MLAHPMETSPRSAAYRQSNRELLRQQLENHRQNALIVTGPTRQVFEMLVRLAESQLQLIEDPGPIQAMR